jgi:hypothetical protein
LTVDECAIAEVHDPRKEEGVSSSENLADNVLERQGRLKGGPQCGADDEEQSDGHPDRLVLECRASLLGFSSGSNQTV